MSSNTSSPADFVEYVRLTNASHWIYRVWVMGFLIVGALGNTVALIIFLRWTNRLSIYVYLTFLCLVNTFVMVGDMQYHYLLPFLIDSVTMLESILPVTCKCMFFLTCFFRYLFIWLIVAINIDRCLYLVDYSFKSIVCWPQSARIICVGLIIFSFLTNVHFLIFGNQPVIQNTSLSSQCHLDSFYRQCEPSNDNYRYFMKRIWPIYNLLLFGIIPCLIIVICGVLIIRSIQSTWRAVTAQGEGRGSKLAIASDSDHCRSIVQTLICLDLLFPVTIFPVLCFHIYVSYHPP